MTAPIHGSDCSLGLALSIPTLLPHQNLQTNALITARVFQRERKRTPYRITLACRRRALHDLASPHGPIPPSRRILPPGDFMQSHTALFNIRWFEYASLNRLCYSRCRAAPRFVRKAWRTFQHSRDASRAPFIISLPWMFEQKERPGLSEAIRAPRHATSIIFV